MTLMQEPAQNRTSTARDDGTTQLLRGGGSMVALGIISGALLEMVFGGMTPMGATTNAGWLALIVTLMCLPFGGLLLALGLAKWLRNRALARRN